jgi:flagellar protein FlaF
MSGRDVEAYALTKAAMALRDCQQNWHAPDRDQILEQALRINQRLWSILQAELTKAENPLPSHIKQNLLRLSVFIDKRIIKIMAEPKQEFLNIIININENLAAGLREVAVFESKAEGSSNGS